MSKTVFHAASRQWLSVVYAKQLDEALAAARAASRIRRPACDEIQTEVVIPAGKITSAEWVFAVGRDAALLQRLDHWPMKLGQVADLFVGVQTDADDVFILEEVRRSGTKVLCSSKHTCQEHWLEGEHLKPFLKGSLNIRRYGFSAVSKLLIFPYQACNGKSVLIPATDYAVRFPLTWAYLIECQPRLKVRNKGRMGSDWYGYVYKKNHQKMSQPKLLVPSLATGGCFAPDLEGTYTFVGSGGGGGGGYGVTLHMDIRLDYSYLLGILNSTLVTRYLRVTSTPFRGGYIALNRQYIENIPIRPIDFDNPADVALHDKMVMLVDRMLDLNKKKAAEKNPNILEQLETQISATDRQIDRLTYQLYNLTPEEIAIVEGGR
jgi:hypothetical protein